MKKQRTQVVLASGNTGKVQELLKLFSDERLDLVPMSQLVAADYDVEETGTTFEENAWLKAETLCRATGRICLADDSGLEVDALQGAPGVYSARYAGVQGDDAGNNRKLIEELRHVKDAQRGARFVCVLALALPSAVPSEKNVRKLSIVRGVIEGRIGYAAKGENGFGYDPFFYPLSDHGRTTAEMTPEEKNRISHRAVAARALNPMLQRLLSGEFD